MNKHWIWLTIFFFSQFGIGGAQDVIHRKNGEAITVYGLTSTGKTISYKLPGDPAGTLRYINATEIDSILFANGEKSIFQHFPEPMNAGSEEKPFKRNSVGLDVAALAFYKNIKLSYTYFPKSGKLGIVAGFSKNQNPIVLQIYDESGYEPYINLSRTLQWNVRAGIDAYIFEPGPFRIAGGLHWIYGKYSSEKIQTLPQEPWYVSEKKTDNSMNGILFSTMFIWQFGNFLQLGVGVDVPFYTSSKLNGSNFVSELAIIF